MHTNFFITKISLKIFLYFILTVFAAAGIIYICCFGYKAVVREIRLFYIEYVVDHAALSA